MKRMILAALLLSLPYSVLAGEVRIVKCTEGMAAVQESYEAPCSWDCAAIWSPPTVTEWRTLPGGCQPLEAAKRMYAEEIAWRNGPPAPTILEPVQVITP